MILSADQDELRDLFANLLATSMDSLTGVLSHPAFVEVIKNLTPDEARLLKHIANDFSNTGNTRWPAVSLKASASADGRQYLERVNNFTDLAYSAGCDHPGNTFSYLDNLCRLRLVDLRFDQSIQGMQPYEKLKTHIIIREAEQTIRNTLGLTPSFEYGVIKITFWGLQFLQACVLPHKEAERAATAAKFS